MKMNSILLFTLLLFIFDINKVAHSAVDPNSVKSIMSNLQVPPQIRKQKHNIATQVAEGWKIINKFASQHKWQKYMKTSFFDKVEIYMTQQQLWLRVLELHKLPKNTKMPTNGLVAGLEKRVLLAVTPSAYKHIRPEYGKTKGAYARLLAHEIGHRLHVAILHGKEKQMGPSWFYEGFAVIASGDLIAPAITEKQLWQATKVKGRGAYKKYGQILRFLSKHIPLPELVRQAGKKNFTKWLNNQLKTRNHQTKRPKKQ